MGEKLYDRRLLQRLVLTRRLAEQFARLLAAKAASTPHPSVSTPSPAEGA